MKWIIPYGPMKDTLKIVYGQIILIKKRGCYYKLFCVINKPIMHVAVSAGYIRVVVNFMFHTNDGIESQNQ